MPTKIIHYCSVVALLIQGLSVNAAEMIYKCKNEQDKTIYQKKPCTENTQTLSSWTPKAEKILSPAATATKEEIIIKQAPDGHYYVKAEVNSQPIVFIIDTGASMVSIPNQFAASNNLFCGNAVKANTANGTANGCETLIAELRLGYHTIKNVRATIMQNLDVPLLGMNILQGYDISQKNGEMRFTERDK